MMKRFLPILFLVPSVALILYAKRARQEELVELRIRVETGGFAFPDGVALQVATAAGRRAPVEDGWARISVPRSGLATLRLEVTERGDASRSAPVGEPREVEFDPDAAEPSGSLAVTPDECRAALAKLRG